MKSINIYIKEALKLGKSRYKYHPKTKEEIVSEHLIKLGFTIVEVVRDGGWCAIVATV